MKKSKKTPPRRHPVRNFVELLCLKILNLRYFSGIAFGNSIEF
jgi:hypothetical protein